jgi:hypothetical protein
MKNKLGSLGSFLCVLAKFIGCYFLTQVTFATTDSTLVVPPTIQPLSLVSTIDQGVNQANCTIVSVPIASGSSWPNNQLYTANFTTFASSGANSQTRTIQLLCPVGTVAIGTTTLTTVFPAGSGAGVQTMDFRLSLTCCPLHYQWTTIPSCTTPQSGNCLM